MRSRFFPALAALSLILSACETLPSLPAKSKSQSRSEALQRSGQIEMKLASGTYRCEQGMTVKVEREMRDQVNHHVRIAWNGSNYRLERDLSKSGLPRFEDGSSGLVWIDLPWKGLLLDGKTNRPLASECHFT